jgi:hypothetical protein
MASRPVTGGASRPSLFGVWLSFAIALAIGSAPVVALLTGGF